VEVVKGLCLLTVLPDYNKLKKYNLNELGVKSSDNDKDDAEKTIKSNSQETTEDVQKDES
jgi:tRNA acetyltransferase TAN1